MINTNNMDTTSPMSFHDLVTKVNNILDTDITDITTADLIKFVSEKDESKSKTLVLNWVLSNLPSLFAQNDTAFNYAISHETLFSDNTEYVAKYLIADSESYHDLFMNYPKQFANLLSNYSYTFYDYSSLYNCLLLQKIIADLSTFPYNKDYALIASALININSGDGPEYPKIKQKVSIKIPECYYHQLISNNWIDPDIIITLSSKNDVDCLSDDLLMHKIDLQTPIIIMNDKVKDYIASRISLLKTCTYSKALNTVKARLQTLV